MLASFEDRVFDKDYELDWYRLEDGAKNANRSVLDQNRLNFPSKALKQAIFIVNPLSCTCNPVRSLRIGPRNGQRRISTSGRCANYYVTGHVTALTSTRSEERVTAALTTHRCDAHPCEALHLRSTSLAKLLAHEELRPRRIIADVISVRRLRESSIRRCTHRGTTIQFSPYITLI